MRVLVASVGLLVAGSLLVLGFVRSLPGDAPLPDQQFSLPPDQVADPNPAPSGHELAPRDADRLVIPSLGVAAPLDVGAVEGGLLELPDDIEHTVLWGGSAPVSAGQGSLLVAGHLDNAERQRGALYALSTIQPGAEVQLVRHHRVSDWKVVGLSSAPKTELPAEVWAGWHGPRRLYVVTCGGPIVSGHYADNVVVTAVPVRPD